MNTSQNPLEAELMGEVAQATIRGGFDRESGEAVMRRLANRLTGRPVLPGRDIRKCYDLVHHRPSPDYAAKYSRARHELQAAGIDLS